MKVAQVSPWAPHGRPQIHPPLPRSQKNTHFRVSCVTPGVPNGAQGCPNGAPGCPKGAPVVSEVAHGAPQVAPGVSNGSPRAPVGCPSCGQGRPRRAQGSLKCSQRCAGEGLFEMRCESSDPVRSKCDSLCNRFRFCTSAPTSPQKILFGSILHNRLA